MAKKEKPDAIATIVSAALAQGLSYGKYMAKYGYRPPCIYGQEPNKPMTVAQDDYEDDVTDKVCAICGCKFPPGRAMQAKTCSKACSEKLLLRNRKHVENRRCAYCGADIPTSVHLLARYCGDECHRAALRQRARDRAREKAAEKITQKGEITINATGEGVSKSTWAAMQLLDPRRG